MVQEIISDVSFQGQQIRTCTDNKGVFWWNATDIGAILDLQDVHTSLRGIPEDEISRHSMPTPGGMQTMLTVNEPGLYRLIFQSRKPEAESFKNWIFREVLPTIRRTGTYTQEQTLPAPLSRIRERAEISIQLLSVWKVLRTATEPLTNREIASMTGTARRTVRAHTRYLLQLGLLEAHELFPGHLYEIAEQAEKRHAGYWLRLEKLSALVDERTARIMRGGTQGLQVRQ